MNLYIGILGMKLPSFPTKGQPEIKEPSCTSVLSLATAAVATSKVFPIYKRGEVNGFLKGSNVTGGIGSV